MLTTFALCILLSITLLLLFLGIIVYLLFVRPARVYRAELASLIKLADSTSIGLQILFEDIDYPDLFFIFDEPDTREPMQVLYDRTTPHCDIRLWRDVPLQLAFALVNQSAAAYDFKAAGVKSRCGLKLYTLKMTAEKAREFGLTVNRILQ